MTLVTAPAGVISLSYDDRWLTWLEEQSEADVWLAALER
jgi:hypothetical protein